MTVAMWMILVAAILPYLCTGAAKFGGSGYDNAEPRASLARLAGWRARADGAQRNGFEAFPPFAAAVLVAQFAHAPQGRVDLLAMAFIVIRVLYILLYISGVAWLRSVVWGFGLLIVMLLFYAGARA